ADQPPRKVSADRGGMLAALIGLWPFMWPADRPDLKRRALLALAALVVAKVVTVLVPFLYKWATDAIVPAGAAAGESVPAGTVVAVAVAVPVLLVVAYGLGRVLLTAFNQL